MKDEESTRSAKPAFSLENFESGVVSVSAGWLKEVWNKWPGDETIDEVRAGVKRVLGESRKPTRTDVLRTWREGISVDPNVCHGKACIKGTRIMVSVVFE